MHALYVLAGYEAPLQSQGCHHWPGVPLGVISLTVVVSAVCFYSTKLGIARGSTDVTVAYLRRFSDRQPRCPGEY